MRRGRIGERATACPCNPNNQTIEPRPRHHVAGEQVCGESTADCLTPTYRATKPALSSEAALGALLLGPGQLALKHSLILPEDIFHQY